jgi:HYR domain
VRNRFLIQPRYRYALALVGAVAGLMIPAAAQADPPTITPPPDLTVEAGSAAGAIVDYRLPTASDDNGPPSVECDPAPGSRFPVGRTTVRCSAVDHVTGEGTVVSFVIRVTPRAQERASSGGVEAKLFYVKPPGGDFLASFKNFRIQISRRGVPILDAPASPDEYAPAGYGDRPSVFVRDLDGDREPEVLLDLYSGGAHCCFSSRIYRYDADEARYRVSLHSWGDPSYRLRDVDSDGTPEFVTADDRFAYRFASFAFSGMPIQLWSYRAGKFANVTRRFPKLVAKDSTQQWRCYLHNRKDGETQGFLARGVQKLCRVRALGPAESSQTGRPVINRRHTTYPRSS